MIDRDIRIASTPPGSFYNSTESYIFVQDKIFARTWQFIGDKNSFSQQNYLYPVWLLNGCLNEPLLVSSDAAKNLTCMSNVCTHRGFVLVEEPMKSTTIRCRYHGRCFSPHGKFLSMPEFEEAINFPTRIDDLAQLQVKEFAGMYFTSIFPEVNFEEIIQPILQRMNWFPFSELQFSAEHSKEYHIKANWALYCDNYLEGFHIPYVHKSLNKVIDYGNYETQLYKYCNLQLGIAKEGELIFDIPAGAEDAGKNVAGYYWWIFPNMMLNFYPWGLSVNIVQPKGKDETTISFRTYICDETKFNQGAGSDLNRVELEDEEVVESVHKGLQSRLYFRGRYSPKMETGVHHFHRLMTDFLNK